MTSLPDLPGDHPQRIQRAELALEGLSVGDALGQQFFFPQAWEWISSRSPPPGPWYFTDDTAMALSIRDVLAAHGRIDQDALATRFAQRFVQEPRRGYGSGSFRLLQKLAAGADWRSEAKALFHGQGSLGNGAAMRVAPLGAYFADDLPKAAQQARLSAEVTHAHLEGQAGAIAVAVAAAWAFNRVDSGRRDDPRRLLQAAVDLLPPSLTRQAIRRAVQIPLDAWEHEVAAELGCGEHVTAPDTVPFCLWCAAAHLDDFAAALWAAIRVGGDIDTNNAIVGGIVAVSVGRSGIPPEWIAARESLPPTTGTPRGRTPGPGETSGISWR